MSAASALRGPIRANSSRVEAPETVAPGARYSEPVSLLERITIDSEVVHGRPAIRGTRMRVADVLSLLAAGASEEEILADYPYLVADDVRACLAYAAAQANHTVVIAS